DSRDRGCWRQISVTIFVVWPCSSAIVILPCLLDRPSSGLLQLAYWTVVVWLGAPFAHPTAANDETREAPPLTAAQSNACRERRRPRSASPAAPAPRTPGSNRRAPCAARRRRWWRAKSQA